MVHESTMIKRNPNLFLTGRFPLAQNLGIALAKNTLHDHPQNINGNAEPLVFSPWMKYREET
jgi:hypothetical protein